MSVVKVTEITREYKNDKIYGNDTVTFYDYTVNESYGLHIIKSNERCYQIQVSKLNNYIMNITVTFDIFSGKYIGVEVSPDLTSETKTLYAYSDALSNYVDLLNLSIRSAEEIYDLLKEEFRIINE